MLCHGMSILMKCEHRKQRMKREDSSRGPASSEVLTPLNSSGICVLLQKY